MMQHRYEGRVCDCVCAPSGKDRGWICRQRSVESQQHPVIVGASSEEPCTADDGLIRRNGETAARYRLEEPISDKCVRRGLRSDAVICRVEVRRIRHNRIVNQRPRARIRVALEGKNHLGNRSRLIRQRRCRGDAGDVLFATSGLTNVVHGLRLKQVLGGRNQVRNLWQRQLHLRRSDTRWQINLQRCGFAFQHRRPERIVTGNLIRRIRPEHLACSTRSSEAHTDVRIGLVHHHRDPNRGRSRGSYRNSRSAPAVALGYPGQRRQVERTIVAGYAARKANLQRPSFATAGKSGLASSACPCCGFHAGFLSHGWRG